MSMDIIPFVQSDPVPGACRLDAAADQALRRRLEGRSAAIRDAAFVRREWVDFCKTRKHATLSALLAHNRFARKANSRGHLTQFLYTRKDLLGARNAALCETHREVIATLFDDGLV